MHITKSNEPTFIGYILCDSNHMTFWKRQSYEDSKNVSACKELEGREEAQRVFRTVNLFYDI